EIADENGAAGGFPFTFEPSGHFVDEGELVREFVVDRGIGFVAARGTIEIMDSQPARLAPQPYLQVPRIALGAKLARDRVDDRQLRDDCDAVIALLAV